MVFISQYFDSKRYFSFYISHLVVCAFLWEPSTTTIIYAEFYNFIKWACAGINNTWYECSSSFYNKNHRPFFLLQNKSFQLNPVNVSNLQNDKHHFLDKYQLMQFWLHFGNECSLEIEFCLISSLYSVFDVSVWVWIH